MTNPDNTPETLMVPLHRPAEWVFMLLALLFSVWLLANIGEQASFSKGKGFVNQPGFWPAISLGGMVFFSAICLVDGWRRRGEDSPHAVRAELLAWLQVLEYPVWFLGYVWLVPWLGYLPSTLLFSLVLAWRLGYRSRAMLVTALLGGLCVVLIFKTFLEVKIPGGQLYEYFPAAVRNFMIVNF